MWHLCCCLMQQYDYRRTGPQCQHHFFTSRRNTYLAAGASAAAPCVSEISGWVERLRAATQQSLHSLPIQTYFPATPWALFCFPLKLRICKRQGSKGFWGCKSSSLSIPPQLSVCVCVVFKSKAGRCQACFLCVCVITAHKSVSTHTHTHCFLQAADMLLCLWKLFLAFQGQNTVSDHITPFLFLEK